MPDTSYLIVTSGSEQSPVVEDQHQLAERVDTQQRDIKAQHHEINALRAFINQTLGQAQAQPPPPPSPLPPSPSDEAKDLHKH